MYLFYLIWKMLLGLFCLLLLPFTPTAEDRRLAAQTYRGSLRLIDQARQQRSPWSLLNWLDRAARRQEKMNAINLPGYHQLQKRKWERAYCYKRLIKQLLFWFALVYGSERFDPLLYEYSPNAHQVAVRVNYWAVGRINAFWKAAYEALPDTNQ
jgi:hypothetical protein